MRDRLSAGDNHLLGSLPGLVLARLTPALEAVQLEAGQVLYEAGGRLTHMYFPLSAIVSLQYVMRDGASAEIAVVGHDGVIGVTLFMGGESTSSRALVRGTGQALRLPAALLKEEFSRQGELQILLLRYAQVLLTQMAQSAACNRHHSIEQQLCRCLLLSLDRVRNTTLALTQELIANLLGVRREGVSEAAGRLQQQGVIRYNRGSIVVLDRARLEALCCECYAVVKSETDRITAIQ